MYIGEHGLTVIELPDSGTVYSRDLYLDVKPQCVVEIPDMGRFVVHSRNTQFRRDETVSEVETSGAPLKPPCYLMRINVASGDFSGIETDFHYTPGIDLRGDEETGQPIVQLELGPPKWMQTALIEASSLRAEADAIAAGRLHASAYEQAVAATVFIVCEYGDGSKIIYPSGTGFLINPHGFIITNGHVVPPILSVPQMPRPFIRLGVKVTLFSGQDREKTVPATVIRHSTTPDLALLKIDGYGHEFLCLDGDNLTEMAPVLALGYPGGQALALSGGQPQMSFRAGQITAFRTEPQTRSVFVEHSAPMEQGNSGGPLVTPFGTVLGVNTQLRGPQLQSRFALSRDTVRGFFFQETAEGKGPYYGPNMEERYTIFMGRAAVAWMYLDNDAFRFITRGLPDWIGENSLPREEALRIGIGSLSALGDLLAALDHLTPPSIYYLSHMKIQEGLRVQSEAIAKMVGLLTGEAEDQLTAYSRSHSGVSGRSGRVDTMSSAMNDWQTSRDQLNLAFNRVIGQFWDMMDQVKQPPPFNCILQPSEYTPEIEQQVLAELGNIFQRHRGKRVAIVRFRMTDAGGPWERIIVYRHSLVSGSDALLREMARLIKDQGWGTSTERLADPSSAQALG